MSPAGERNLDRWLEEVRAEYWNRLAHEVEDAEAIGVPHVIFRVAGQILALEAALCKAVVRRSRVARLPGVPSHILGVAGIRGEVLSATDLKILLGLPGERGEGRGYFLVVGADGLKTALWVDWVADVVPVDDARLVRGESPWPQAPEGVVLGQWQGREPCVHVLDGGRILEVSAVRSGVDGA